MTENSTTSPGMLSLTVVRSERKKKNRAKLVSLKVPTANKVLLPPLQEGYIKAKKHDFL